MGKNMRRKGEDKKKKMQPTEVTIMDVILENRELKTRIVNLEEKYKDLEEWIRSIQNTPPELPTELMTFGGDG